MAYDTVDHELLLLKLNHYGIRGEANDIMRSYLTNRRQFVKLDTFNSTILNTPPCSVVQGGKLSGLLYNIYINEVPLLYKLLNDKDINTNYKNTNYKDIQHDTIQFVDDSTNVITFKHTNTIKDYVQTYYQLLHDYYNCNKLKINHDKTKYIIITSNKLKTHFKNFYMTCDKYKIKPSNNIKILGIILSNDATWDTEIGKLCATLDNRIHNINKLKKYTNFKTRLDFINAFVIGKLRYMLPLYMNTTN